MSTVTKKYKSNQTLMVNGDVTLLISYWTPVAAKIGEKYYKTEKRFSVTTSKHIRRFCAGETEVKPQEFFYKLERELMRS